MLRKTLDVLTSPIRAVNSGVRAGWEVLTTPFTMAFEGIKGGFEAAFSWAKNGAIAGAIGGLVSAFVDKEKGGLEGGNWFSRAVGGAFIGATTFGAAGVVAKGTQSALEEGVDSAKTVGKNLQEAADAIDVMDIVPTPTPNATANAPTQNQSQGRT